MTAPFHVKRRLLFAAALLLSPCARAQDTPDPKAILKTVRIAQSAQNRTVTGRLRTGGKAIPFTLKTEGTTVRWDFTDPAQTLLLRLGEKDSRLEEIGKDGPAKITGARFDDKIRGSDVTYEDLSMRFLYWPTAEVEGEQTMVLTKCWIVRVEPPARSDSQYSKVKLWISKNDGALLQAEAFGHDGKLARRFKVLSGQKTEDGLWMLKQMRIEAPGGARASDQTPTYLEIDRPK
jgi:hypothetical protein